MEMYLTHVYLSLILKCFPAEAYNHSRKFAELLFSTDTQYRTKAASLCSSHSTVHVQYCT